MTIQGRQNVFTAMLNLLKVKHTSEFERIINDWFEKGKPLKEAFFDDLLLEMKNPEIEVEFQKHESWKVKSQLRATPTILVNGYKLPDNYKIEDLRYFEKIKEWRLKEDRRRHKDLSNDLWIYFCLLVSISLQSKKNLMLTLNIPAHCKQAAIIGQLLWKIAAVEIDMF